MFILVQKVNNVPVYFFFQERPDSLVKTPVTVYIDSTMPFMGYVSRYINIEHLGDRY